MRTIILLYSAHVAASLSLGGLTCRVTLNIGREPGTWMDEEWAKSGARMSLPVDVIFSDEPAATNDEQNFLGRGNAISRLYCDSGSFVGPQGEVIVEATGGAWSAQPTGQCGENVFRFYIDFPKEAARNDVTLPAGRVYFSSACWNVDERQVAQAEADALKEEIEAIIKTKDAETDYAKAKGQESDVGFLERADAFRKAKQRSDKAMPLVALYRQMLGSLPDEAIAAPNGKVEVLTKGGMSIKRNDARNLWGGLGDVFLILGRFSVAEGKRARSGAAASPDGEDADRAI